MIWMGDAGDTNVEILSGEFVEGVHFADFLMEMICPWMGDSPHLFYVGITNSENVIGIIADMYTLIGLKMRLMRLLNVSSLYI